MSAQHPLQTTLPLRPRSVSQGPVQPKKKKDIVAKWDAYFGTNQEDLAKWKQLCRDLGKPSESFTSKNQCRKVRGAPLLIPQIGEKFRGRRQC